MPLVVPYSTHHLHQFHLSIISFLFIEQHQLPCPSAAFPFSIPHFKLLSLLSKTSLLIFLHQQYNTIILVHHRCSILPSYWSKRPSAPPSSACLASAVERLCCCLLRPWDSSPSSALCSLLLVAAFDVLVLSSTITIAAASSSPLLYFCSTTIAAAVCCCWWESMSSWGPKPRQLQLLLLRFSPWVT